MKVPFMDLRALHEAINDEIHAAIKSVVGSCAFAGGPFVEKFEEEFAAFCKCKHAIGVGSGTEALWLTLLALGVGEGDEVITVPNTFIATAEAISFCGATPTFVDVDDQTYTIDTRIIEAAITPRTKAIIPVHLFGQMADMDPIMEVADKYGLSVVEDASQAHGAKDKLRYAGTIGDAGCFSFYPGKNLGAIGEAGAVTTDNHALADKIRILRDHGQLKKNNHSVVGWNGRMDGVQAAVLSVKLKHLDRWNQIRRKNAQLYNSLLSDVKEVKIPHTEHTKHHVYHIYSVRVPHRDKLITSLEGMGISCGVHYPSPIHMQEAYISLGKEQGSYPVAEECAREFVSLPMCPMLKAEQIEFVSNNIKEIISKGIRLSA